jgi:DNA polymerase (family 10)
MKNFEIARLFYEMASLLEVRSENAFRVRAYQRGARTLESLAEDIEAVAARGALTALPGIGKDLASAIEEYLATGANPWVNILVHPTGRLIGSRDPNDVDMEAVFAAARAHGQALEINGSPARLDLGDVHARRAGELGIPLVISTDTHYLSNLDGHLDLGVAVARRAWLEPRHVLNTRPLADLLAWARPPR